MSYRWKPNATQRREFAARMQDANEREYYERSKREKEEKRRETSSFNYENAGGTYVPTQAQYDYALHNRSMNTSAEHDDACNQVCFGFSCNEKIHHDYIHIVNELIRRKSIS